MAEELRGLLTCPVCQQTAALTAHLRVIQVATTPEPLYQSIRRVTRQYCRCDPLTILEAWHREAQALRQAKEPPHG